MSQAGVINVAGGSGGAGTITGNTGGPQSQTANNWNIVTENSTVQFAGASSTLTLDFGVINLGIGSDFSSLTIGGNNVGLGRDALDDITNGNGNTAIGALALSNLSVGSANTAVGSQALSSLITGSNVVAFGSEALQNYTGSNASVAIGTGALTNSINGDNNTAVGHLCLASLASNTSQNTAVGSNAAGSLTSGDQNTIMGALSFLNAVSASNCAAFGYQALNSCTGDGNSGFGRAALVQLQSGQNNSALGLNSLFGVTTGDNNTAVGASALFAILTGSNNIALGRLAGSFHTLADSNNIDIGNTGVLGESNTIRIGNSTDISIAYIAGQLNGLSGRCYKITTPGAYPYTTLITDHVVLVNSSSARTINLIASPTNTPVVIIKDSTGGALINNITISGNGKTIDGSASTSIAANYASRTLVYNGTEWNII